MHTMQHRRNHLLKTLLFALLILSASQLLAQHPALVTGVDAVSITVSDMDRAVDFYSKVLTFEKVSDAEVASDDFEHLEGVFGLRMRVVRMKLGRRVHRTHRISGAQGQADPGRFAQQRPLVPAHRDHRQRHG